MADQTYCIYCGSPLLQDSAECPRCGRKQEKKEDAFRIFLWKNTKDKIRGKIDDSLFEIIKNWLISHLYGLVLLLTVIGTVVYAA